MAIVALALAPAAAATAQVQPYGTNDFGGFTNVLPPGENGFDNLAQAAAFKASGTYPAHANDQLGMYSTLATAVPISQAQIPQYYKDATFGVKAGDVAGTEAPEAGVTIVRDSRFGVPHIYGDTRAALIYPADSVCSAGDQMCSDSIQFRAIGVITQPLIEWVNRPTFQQADEIAGHRP